MVAWILRDVIHDRKLRINSAVIHVTILVRCYVPKLVAVIGVYCCNV